MVPLERKVKFQVPHRKRIESEEETKIQSPVHSQGNFQTLLFYFPLVSKLFHNIFFKSIDFLVKMKKKNLSEIFFSSCTMILSNCHFDLD